VLLASWFAFGLVAWTSGDAVDGQSATRTGLPAVSAPVALSQSGGVQQHCLREFGRQWLVGRLAAT
jgi:hypothetical protein